VTGLVYDSGALLAAERADDLMWALHRRTLERGVRPVVPAVVLGQVWRGGPQARLSRLLQGCIVEAFDENAGRGVGCLLRDAGTSDVVDAAVVRTAARSNAAVVTSDPRDLAILAAAGGRSIRLYRV
jgi:hypothetical protein